ncbi:uncharacterized protein TEOVI_000178900 [Trypanosoma equiperdum]|uniref:Uncharacterized protein n=3 Tax=Trypanozoon TaxID=39700 RepID=D0A8X6_TRYB9|nr:hypothetical protein, unlikely [Trypanosoma brucei gambiense DAL972]RHW68137.1 hypothetical protein DPX39_110087700 [Trypanosoma brucei equiperdum]CBH18127.1 hypothetical protein, unlikely [Trypanosoma brucei gambiense DAL972]SCU70216.1 hypothetical protein, conserved [Trypanosoma equiperdum]|eukprot:XP_011780391.1 hypothetical protein, unlikely [Trypanosoma brucei gambiense DAL972]
MGGPPRKREREGEALKPKSKEEQLPIKNECTLDRREGKQIVAEKWSEVVVDDNESQERSNESVSESQVYDTEEELLAAGEDLSGDALKDFLRKNFVDFIDEKVARVGDLDLMN